jgi:hypothetical protein
MSKFIQLTKYSQLMELEEVESELYIINTDSINMILPTKDGTCLDIGGGDLQYLHVQESFEEISKMMNEIYGSKKWLSVPKKRVMESRT